MIKVLVTGAGGQLGRSLRDAISEKKDVTGVFLVINALDIRDPDALETAFQEHRPDYCVNCAAYTNVEGAEEFPQDAMEVNALAVEGLARCCHRHETVLIHLSTDYVFDGENPEGYWPADPPNPINAYGRSKLEGERRIPAVLEAYYIIRTSWLYSLDYGPNFYLTILEKAQRGEALQVTDAQVGCPTRADHLSDFILELIMTGNRDYGIVHFTDGQAMSWYAFAQKALTEAGLLEGTALSKGENYRTLARRPKCSILNSGEK